MRESEGWGRWSLRPVPANLLLQGRWVITGFCGAQIYTHIVVHRWVCTRTHTRTDTRGHTHGHTSVGTQTHTDTRGHTDIRACTHTQECTQQHADTGTRWSEGAGQARGASAQRLCPCSRSSDAGSAAPVPPEGRADRRKVPENLRL